MKGGSRVRDDVAPRVEEARAARAAQVLASRGREHVAADPADVDGELADRLAGVEQIQDAVPRGDRAHLRGRIDEAALCRHVGDRDEPRARPDRALERGHVHLPRGVVADDVDLDAHALLHLQEGEIVRGVLGPRGDDAVSRAKGDRIERHVPGPRGVLHERDLVPVGTDQGGDGVIDVGHPIRGLRGGLVSADGGLSLQMARHRLHDRPRRQGRPGIVEVQDIGDAGCVGPQERNVEHHRVQISSTGSSPRSVVSMTDSIAGSRRRRSAVSRAGVRSGRRSTLLISATTRAPAGTPLRPPSG